MMLQSAVPAWQTRNKSHHRSHYNARRILRFLPVLVFLLTLMVLAAPAGHSAADFVHAILQSAAAALASCFVSIAAFGFYRYMLDRSPGL